MSTLVVPAPGKDAMSPRRGQYQNTAAISDYESDGNCLTDVPLPPAQRTDQELNLAVLRRHNPEVITLEYVAPYAVVYVFSPSSQQWEKTGVEGTAFVCGLFPTSEYPVRYIVTVLNRRGLNNFTIELLSTADVEVTEEYIILQSENADVPQVYGLWVFSEPPPSSTARHRELIASKIQACAERVEDEKRALEDQQGQSYEARVEDPIPLRRQLSFEELLGQQQQQDASWSVSPQRQTSKSSPQGSPLAKPSSSHTQSHRNALLDLFRQTGDAQRGATS